ncbi:hypothetical protein DFJ74DRAFT_745896 [Hyaloraphidium curvatum]|nr:hypothetical protein DFJ74DRAFT_745896 [Hyaloraphidium curvatum]
MPLPSLFAGAATLLLAVAGAAASPDRWWADATVELRGGPRPSKGGKAWRQCAGLVVRNGGSAPAAWFDGELEIAGGVLAEAAGIARLSGERRGADGALLFSVAPGPDFEGPLAPGESLLALDFCVDYRQTWKARPAIGLGSGAVFAAMPIADQSPAHSLARRQAGMFYTDYSSGQCRCVVGNGLPRPAPATTAAAPTTTAAAPTTTAAAPTPRAWAQVCPDGMGLLPSACSVLIRPQAYPVTQAAINLAEVELYTASGKIPISAVNITLSTVLRWNNSFMPGFLDLTGSFCNDGNLTSVMYQSTNVTNTGPGQICHTATGPFNGFWDPCPTLRAEYPCSYGALQSVAVYNRWDTTCSGNCKGRINRFAMDAVRDGVWIGTFNFTSGETTPVYTVQAASFV